MKKSFVTIGLIMALSITSSITAFAGWEQTGATWKYNSNGTYFNNGWNWIDGNSDGVSECYYFNADGIMLASTITPGNYFVNKNGAWIVNGIVQTQPAPKQQESKPAPQPQQEQTQSQSQNTNPAPTPQPTQPTNTVPDASNYTTQGNITFDDTPLSEDQSLPSNIEDAINSVQFN